MSTSPESHSSRLERRGRKLAITAGVLGAYAVLYFGVSNVETLEAQVHALQDSTPLENTTEAVLSQAFGDDVTVNCDTEYVSRNDTEFSQIQASVNTYALTIPFTDKSHIVAAADIIHMRENLCEDISVLESDPRLFEPTMKALYSATHEKEHINGVYDEAEATCYAIQRMPEVYERLGMTSAEAQIAAEQTVPLVENAYWSPSIDYQAAVTRTYLTPDCRPGTDLDLGTGGPFITRPTIG